MLEAYASVSQWVDRTENFIVQKGNRAYPVVYADGTMAEYTPSVVGALSSAFRLNVRPLEQAVTKLLDETECRCQRLGLEDRGIRAQFNDMDYMRASELADKLSHLKHCQEVQVACLDQNMDDLLALFIADPDPENNEELIQQANELMGSYWAKFRMNIYADNYRDCFRTYQELVNTKLAQIQQHINPGNQAQFRACSAFTRQCNKALTVMDHSWESQIADRRPMQATAIADSVAMDKTAAAQAILEALAQSRTAITQIKLDTRRYPTARKLFLDDIDRLQAQMAEDIAAAEGLTVTHGWLRIRQERIEKMRAAMYAAISLPNPETIAERPLPEGRGQLDNPGNNKHATAYAYACAYAGTKDYFLLRPLPEDQKGLEPLQQEWLATFEHIRNQSEYAAIRPLPECQSDDCEFLGRLVPAEFNTAGTYTTTLFAGAFLKDSRARVFIGLRPQRRGLASSEPPSCFIVKGPMVQEPDPTDSLNPDIVKPSGMVDQLSPNPHIGFIRNAFNDRAAMLDSYSYNGSRALCIDDLSRPE